MHPCATCTNASSSAPVVFLQAVALETFTRLEHLTMNGCTGMTSIALNLPFLRVLSLDGCSALTQVCTFSSTLSTCLHQTVLSKTQVAPKKSDHTA